MKHTEATKRKIALANRGRTAWNKGKKCPQTTGEKNGVWLGINAPYHAIHQWMLRYYGKAAHCEAADCSGKSGHYEWSLLKGHEYQRRRENFWQLCKSCHRRYDFTDRERKIVASRKRNPHGQFA